MTASTCKHCGRPIFSIDGWLHTETGLRQCVPQPPPLVAEPDEDACD